MGYAAMAKMFGQPNKYIHIYRTTCTRSVQIFFQLLFIWKWMIVHGVLYNCLR